MIAEFEKNFTKATDFETLKTSFGKITEGLEAANTIITGLTKTNTELTEKFTKQEGLINDIFELVKKIGDVPAEESKFAKKDGLKKESGKSKIDELMEEAKILSAKTFK